MKFVFCKICFASYAQFFDEFVKLSLNYEFDLNEPLQIMFNNAQVSNALS